jgi:uncharacterized membrane protein
VSPIYLVLKTLHVVAVVVLIGNLITSQWWKEQADKTGDAKTIAHTLNAIKTSHFRFTMPAVILLLLGGFGAMGVSHLPFSLKWIWGGTVLLVVGMFAGMGRVAPLTKKACALFPDSPQGGASYDREAYARLSAQIKMWSLIGVLAPVLAVILMVFKPQ